STGQLPHDVGGRLRAPRRGRHLPTVLSADQAASLLTTVGPEGPTGSTSSTGHPADQEPGSDPLQRAVALRDLAVLALLYSPRSHAGSRRDARCSPRRGTAEPERRCSSASVGAGSATAPCARCWIVTPPEPGSPGTSVPMRCATAPPPTWWRAAPTCAACRTS